MQQNCPYCHATRERPDEKAGPWLCNVCQQLVPTHNSPPQRVLADRVASPENSRDLETPLVGRPLGHRAARIAVKIDLGFGAAMMAFAAAPALMSIWQVLRHPDVAKLLLLVIVVLGQVPALFCTALPFLMLAASARWAAHRSAAGAWAALISACVLPILAVLYLNIGKMPVPQLMALAPTAYGIATGGSIATMLIAMFVRPGTADPSPPRNR